MDPETLHFIRLFFILKKTIMPLRKIVPSGIIVLMVLFTLSFYQTPHSNRLPAELVSESGLIKTIDHYAFRDLNKNGRLDVYEDARQPIELRIQDLLKQMTLEEKAGMMFYPPARVNADGSIDDKPGEGLFAFVPNALKLVSDQHISHFNLFAVPAPDTLAIWYNSMQQFAEKTRLGIPLTIASDPRNHFSASIFAMTANSFSQWPEPLGLAAIGDEKVTEQFANNSRQEYLAVGIRQALHPQVDLATEPRWPRISGTFGEDATLTSKMTTAYIKGFQGEKLDSNGVATMTKHFPGGGPQKDGLDPHFDFQKGQVYPGNNFKYHLIPFEAAFKAHTAAIMPYYGVPMGQHMEEVGFSFNKEIVTGLLRNTYHYDGVVCTDWGLVTDVKIGPIDFPARAWGVEKLSYEERVKKIIDASVDQFGGENIPELVVKLVREKKLTEKRIDESVTRLLRLKFELGLFDNPFVDAKKATAIVGNPAFKKAAEDAQRRSLTLLKNTDHILPLKTGSLKIYIKNVNAKLAAAYGTVVDKPELADVAIIRLQTPHYPIASSNMIVQMFHWGDLDFKGKELEDILTLLKTVPTVVDINLDRPAVIPEISQYSKALIANYGASDEALLDVLFGKSAPGGHLPIELPSSMEAVRNQKEDMPHDTKDPLYKFGFGLSY
jgi:beta-glucosidase